AREARPEREDGRGDEQEPGHEPGEGLVARDEEELRAAEAADHAGDREDEHPPPAFAPGREVASISGDAREPRGPERDGGRRVRRDGRHAGEEHRREDDEAPAAGDGVERAADDPGDEEERAEQDGRQARRSITAWRAR